MRRALTRLISASTHGRSHSELVGAGIRMAAYSMDAAANALNRSFAGRSDRRRRPRAQVRPPRICALVLRPLSALLLLCIHFAVSAAGDGLPALAIKDKVTAHEQAWLDYEIGHFASGQEKIFTGTMTVVQSDRSSISRLEGQTLASLSLGETAALTIVFPEQRRWIRLTQDSQASGVTRITRQRPFNTNPGIYASCIDCAPDLFGLETSPLFLRLGADGISLNKLRTAFRIEVSGYLEPIRASELRLEEVLMLRPDIGAAHRRPESNFRLDHGQAVREVNSVFKRRVPPQESRPGEFSCYSLTPYMARHVLNTADLSNIRVEGVSLGQTTRCCVGHAAHDATRICRREAAP